MAKKTENEKRLERVIQKLVVIICAVCPLEALDSTKVLVKKALEAR